MRHGRRDRSARPRPGGARAILTCALFASGGLGAAFNAGAAAPEATTETSTPVAPAATSEDTVDAVDAVDAADAADAAAPSTASPGPAPLDLPPLPLWLHDTPARIDVLPCGLRVVVAQDTSLPVTAVVAAFPTGYEVDPPARRGQTRALALHLEQGNRALRPGGRVAQIHDVGGHIRVAVGARQVRLESLAPDRVTGSVLRGIAEILWANSTSEVRWKQSVTRAAKDRAGRPAIDVDALAQAWEVPALAGAGAVDSAALESMAGDEVQAALSTHFKFENATLVVVGPRTVDVQLAAIRDAFSGHGRRARVPESLDAPPATVILNAPGKRGAPAAFTFAVGSTLADHWQARVICGALNRQPRVDGEPRAAMVCRFHEDPRRAALQITVKGLDRDAGGELLAARLGRLARDPVDGQVLDVERRRQARNLSRQLSTPLELASLLARRSAELPNAPQPETPVWRWLDLEPLAATANAADAAAQLEARFTRQRQTPDQTTNQTPDQAQSQTQGQTPDAVPASTTPATSPTDPATDELDANPDPSRTNAPATEAPLVQEEVP